MFEGLGELCSELEHGSAVDSKDIGFAFSLLLRMQIGQGCSYLFTFFHHIRRQVGETGQLETVMAEIFREPIDNSILKDYAQTGC